MQGISLLDLRIQDHIFLLCYEIEKDEDAFNHVYMYFKHVFLSYFEICFLLFWSLLRQL